MTSQALFKMVQQRRSIRVLRPDPIEDGVIQQTIAVARQAPSAFHSQSARLVVLEDQAHQRFWEIVLEVHQRTTTKSAYARTSERVDGFRSGRGTILFYEDQQTIARMQRSYPKVADNFKVWSEQSSGMVQYLVWLGLAAEGIGASLQHFNPSIDDAVTSEFRIDPTWLLRAQMPFGVPGEHPDEKELLPIEEVVLWRR